MRTWWLAALALLLVAARAHAGIGDVGPDGWTVLKPSADSRVIYVSSSQGDDARDGLSARTAVKSIAKGITLMRHGWPDWLLLQRGDVWREGFGHWMMSGRSGAEPMVIAGYGESPERPLLLTGAGGGFSTSGGGRSPDRIEHVAIVSIAFYAQTRDPDSPEFAGPDGNTGISWLRPGQNFLVEDGLIRSYRVGMVVQAEKDGLRNFQLRRCVIVDSYSANSHSQGIFISNTHGLLIEECVFDHNGWNESPKLLPDARATIFNHNLYIQSDQPGQSGIANTDVVVRGNIIARGASHGMQLRPGGLAEGNLFLRNALAMFAAESPSIVRGNVVLDGRDIADQQRGMGVEIFNIHDTLVENNIVAHKSPDVGGSHGLSLSRNLRNVTMRNNTLYNWRREGNGGVLDFAGGAFENVRFERNIVQDVLSKSRIIAVPQPTVAFSGNVFWTNRPQAEWFRIANEDAGMAQWLAAAGQQSAVAHEVKFADPARDVATYNAALGGRASFDAFMAEARKQGRSNWRPQYTAAAVIAYVREGFRPLEDLGGAGAVPGAQAPSGGTR